MIKVCLKLRGCAAAFISGAPKKGMLMLNLKGNAALRSVYYRIRIIRL